MARYLRKILFAGLLFIAGVGAYARFIEPEWLEVTHGSLRASVTKPLKIAHLSDLHVEEEGTLERQVLAEIERERPDVIAISGDTIPNSGKSEAAAKFLSKLHAPLGEWSVSGNWDHVLVPKERRRLRGVRNVRWIDNASEKLRDDVWIVGIDDRVVGRPNLERAFHDVPKGRFCITLTHSPDLFPKLDGKCPVVLAGHTHGGQVRVPFWGPLWLPPGSGKYVSGWYEGDDSHLYVSRGIGTSIVKLRFLARPEIFFLTLEPRAKRLRASPR